jgi:hypothetical protein
MDLFDKAQVTEAILCTIHEELEGRGFMCYSTGVFCHRRIVVVNGEDREVRIYPPCPIGWVIVGGHIEIVYGHSPVARHRFELADPKVFDQLAQKMLELCKMTRGPNETDCD